MTSGWRWRAPGTLCGEPVDAGDVLIVRDATHRVHALALDTGQPRWSWAAPGMVCGLAAVAGAGVYVAGPGPVVTALDPTVGAVRWRAEPDGGVVSALTVGGDVLVCRTDDGLRGLDRYTGRERWWTDLFSEASAETIDDGLILIARGATDNGNALEGSLVAVDPADGSVAWEYADEEVVDDCPRWLIAPAPPAVVDGRVYVLESNQLRHFGVDRGEENEPFLAAVDRADGRLVRRVPLPGSFRTVAGPPVPAAGRLWLPFAGTDSEVLAVDRRTGSPHVRVALPAPPVTPLARAGDRLYALATDGCVHVIDAGSGALGRSIAVGTPVKEKASTLTVGAGWVAVRLERELVLLPDG